MAPNLPPHNEPPHHWYGAPQHTETNLSDAALMRRLLLVLLFAVLVFALGHSMVRNHFFAGGAQDHQMSHRPNRP